VLTQSSAGQVAGPSNDLELVNYGAGHAWFRAERDGAIRAAAQVDHDLTRRQARQGDENEVRYVLTDAGRRALDEDRHARALEALFGQPWPTVAEASAA
jgi:hypothetical protein